LVYNNNVRKRESEFQECHTFGLAEGILCRELDILGLVARDAEGSAGHADTWIVAAN
jgi:hypothetical protein